MGEAAEMLLDGTCCQGCGEFLDDDSPGFSRCCASCSDSDPLADSDYDFVEDDDDDNYGEFIAVIGQALKEYKKMAYKYKCRKDKCKRTNKGIKHVDNCHANKHKQLAKQAWKNYQEYIEL